MSSPFCEKFQKAQPSNVHTVIALFVPKKYYVTRMIYFVHESDNEYMDDMV